MGRKRFGLLGLLCLLGLLLASVYVGGCGQEGTCILDDDCNSFRLACLEGRCRDKTERPVIRPNPDAGIRPDAVIQPDPDAGFDDAGNAIDAGQNPDSGQPPPTGCGSGTSFFMNGDDQRNADPPRADFIHPGRLLVRNMTVTLDFQPEWGLLANTIAVDIDPYSVADGLWWNLDFNSRQLGMPLTTQRYVDAERAAFADPGHPGLNISGDGRGCNTLTGEFTIQRLVFVEGVPTDFAVQWEQHCEGGEAKQLGCFTYLNPNPPNTPLPAPPNPPLFNPAEVYLVGDVLGDGAVAPIAMPSDWVGAIPTPRPAFTGAPLLAQGSLIYSQRHPNGQIRLRRLVPDVLIPARLGTSEQRQNPTGYENDGWVPTPACGSALPPEDLYLFRILSDGSVAYNCNTTRTAWYDGLGNEIVELRDRSDEILAFGPSDEALVALGNRSYEIRTSSTVVAGPPPMMNRVVAAARTNASGFRIVWLDFTTGACELHALNMQGQSTLVGSYPLGPAGTTVEVRGARLAANDELFYMGRSMVGFGDVVVRRTLTGGSEVVFTESNTSGLLNVEIATGDR